MAQKLLLIDDDLYLRELYEEVFKNEGFDVETAKDGKEGLEKIMASPRDLILLDVMLPQLDGLGILTKLAQEPPKFKLSPIVLLTNLAHDPAVKQALSAGAHSVLIKTSMTPDTLVAKVKEVIGGAPAPKTEKVEQAEAPAPEPAKAA